MNAFQTLLWVEWKKSSAKLGLLFGILGIGSIILISKGVTGVGLTTQVAILAVMYLAGMGMLSFMSYQIGADFKSDRFHPLLLSPVSPWAHLLARTGFQFGSALVFYGILSGVSFFVIEPFLVGNVSRMAGVIYSLNAYFVLGLVLPSLTFMIAYSMVGVSFRPQGKGRRAALFILAVASLIWTGNAFDYALESGGKIFPVMTLKLPDTRIKVGGNSSIDYQFFTTTTVEGRKSYSLKSSGGNQNTGSDNEDNVIPQSDSDPSNNASDHASTTTTSQTSNQIKSGEGFLVPLDGSLPIYFEPILMIFAICFLMIFLSTRIWNEVEI